jgi:hypothetical protein
MTDWMWFAAGVASVVAALMLAALVSRLFREPATHRAGIDEDEDDPEPPLTYSQQRAVTQRALRPSEVTIQPNLYPRGVQSTGTTNLGPPPTYPETPEEHTP